jgi:5'-nucleotidase
MQYGDEDPGACTYGSRAFARLVRMSLPKILLTNDDGWDAPGLEALKHLAAELGEVYVLAPRDPHSYAGHRVTTDSALHLSQTAPRQYTLSGTPADCVRVATTTVFPEVDWVLSGINRGGNLGADLFTSGTVAAAREAALLGKPAIAISQYIRRGLELNWNRSQELLRPVVMRLMAQGCAAKSFWNVNLPHLEIGEIAPVVECDPDNQPLDVRYSREGEELRYAGRYPARPRTPGRDVDLCFAGSITISRLTL